MISKESVRKFQQIYKERYGQEIGKKEAEKRARKLLNLFKAVYKPSSKADD